MGIEIETPEAFLEDFQDPSYFKTFLAYVLKHKPTPPILQDQVPTSVGQAIQKAQAWLWQQRGTESYWNASIEANASLSAQFILMAKGMNYPDHERYAALFRYILTKKNAEGLYSLYYGGPVHYSTNLLIYLAGRVLGYSPDSLELKSIHEYLKAKDIFIHTNMETKLLLAVYGLISWDCVPEISPLLLLIPNEADFTIYSIPYWVRTALVPMAVLCHLRYQLPNLHLSPDEIRNLHPQHQEFPAFQSKSRILECFISNVRKAYALDSASLYHLALRKCEQWIIAHEEPSGDFGGIYPAMQYSLLGLYALGYSLEHPALAKGMAALIRFQTPLSNTLHQQSCVSPVWDTAWSLIALDRSGWNMDTSDIDRIVEWLVQKQIFDPGDWAIVNKTGFGGGWAFQFDNAWYPDTDDSAVVIMSLMKHPHPDSKVISAMQTGLRWLLTMQNPDGGWSAFEQGVDDDYVDMIPFNDMGNWRDPSTADVTGRCLQMLGELGIPKESAAVQKAIQFLRKEQEPDGSWFGRWGVNYIYGTWSVLMGLQHFLTLDDPCCRKAIEWLVRIQRPDGGWGESCDSYIQGKYIGLEQSTASQTAWALLALITTTKQRSPSIERGIHWLLEHQNDQGTWDEIYFTGTGFPRHFYLRYDDYRHYFPLWALGEYARLSSIF